MSVRLLIPTALRPYTDQQAELTLEGATVGEVLERLLERYPNLRRHLLDEEGRLRNFVNIYVNDEDIRYLQHEATPVAAGDQVTIVPSVAGGAAAVPGLAQELTREEILRYSRHLIMPEVAMEGQLKLKQARVLCIGAGGLGSFLSLYLAAAGVGRIGLVDFDVVEASNLQRQILYGTSDVGHPKLVAAKRRLTDLNPFIEVVVHEERLDSTNALELFQEYDIVADGTDNFPTRYLVNDACVLTGKPNVYASIFRFEGQASVFGLSDGPCYRCLYPEPPPPGLVPSCAEGGVLGVLPGLLGAIQATEVLKLILGIGSSLAGRLLLVDALTMQFRHLRLRKNPECPICGAEPTIRRLIDYEAFCGVGGEGEVRNGIPEMSVRELHEALRQGRGLELLDVRTPQEFAICRLPSARLIPLAELPGRLHELDSSREIAVYCKSGGRSAQAVALLRQAGFRKLWNLKGGILAWAREIDPALPTY